MTPDEIAAVAAHTVGTVGEVVNQAHDRIDEVIRFSKLHLVGTLVAIVMALSTFMGGMFALNRFQRALDKADAKMAVADTMNAEYIKQSKLVQEQLASTQVQIAQLASAQAQKQQVIIVRDQAAAAQVAEVTRPGVSAAQALQDFADNNVVAPNLASVTPDGKIAVEVVGAQHITATKIEHDALKIDLADTQVIVQDGEKKFEVCQASTKAVTELNTKCEADKAAYVEAAKAYEKAAKKSKWRKFLDGAVKVALVAGGIALGHAL